MDKAIDYVTQAEKQIDGLMSRIKATEDALKATESLHAENKKDVGDTNTRLSMIESRVDELNKHAEEVMNKLVNILTTYQAIEAAKEEKDGKKDAEEGEDKPSKSKKSAGDDKKKSTNSRKERDKAILEKAAKNKNIK